MADVLPLITAALASLRAGQLPPEALLKSLVSKVRCCAAALLLLALLWRRGSAPSQLPPNT